jgi:RNA methyltransferase, TrmH family
MLSPSPITSRTNDRVKALRASFAGKACEPGELVGIEGETLISEALRSGLDLETLFIRQGSEGMLDLPAFQCVRNKVAVLSADVFDSAMDTRSPQGIAATLIIPDPVRHSQPLPASPPVSVKGHSPRRSRVPDPPVLILESIQDPGNLGTLLRSAEAFGAGVVGILGNSVNEWSPKVIRASAGSVFRQKITHFTLPGIVKLTFGLSSGFYAAVPPQPGAKSLLETTFGPMSMIVIGNEGSGVSAQILSAVTDRIAIPCATESLNAAVAGSVILYEAMRQRKAIAAKEAAREAGREALTRRA